MHKNYLYIGNLYENEATIDEFLYNLEGFCWKVLLT